MVLNAEDRALLVDQTLHRSVVQIAVSQTEVWSPRYLLLLPSNDGESMVLRRDFDRVPIEVSNRVIPAVVPERKLVGSRAEGPSDQLMTQTDSEDRNTPFGQTENGLLGLFHSRRITWTVGHEKPVGLLREDLLDGCLGWNDRNPAATLGQKTRRVGLHTEVVREDVEPLLADGRHLVRLLRGDAARQVETLHERMLKDAFEHLRLVCVGGGEGAAFGSF